MMAQCAPAAIARRLSRHVRGPEQASAKVRRHSPVLVPDLGGPVAASGGEAGVAGAENDVMNLTGVAG
jgi:hypothetical protein